MAETVGFIGLGMMGQPMARNVQKHGHPMVVFDVIEAALLPLVEGGARAASSPREVAASCDVVITMLPDAPDVEQAALGPDGIIEGLGPDAVYVDMSTIDPVTTRRIGQAFAARGLRSMDCPVGRTQDHAVAGTLLLMAGGEAAVIEQARPVLMCMGETLFVCGGPGCGQAMKLTNNSLAAAILAATSEARVPGIKSRHSRDLMREVMGSTMAANAALSTSLPKKALAGDFTPGFMVHLAHKDVRLALEMAHALGVSTPLGDATLATLGEARAQGMDRDDISSVLRLREAHAGVEVRLTKGEIASP
jgi:3-hydroxyisobutyrate dehydrogenase-like beta-hydroxyacid dehydrogenase